VNETSNSEQRTPAERAKLDQKLDSIGWGLFFLWVGTALLLGIGWGFGLLGVGAIVVGEQIARRVLGLAMNGFWVVIGVVFLLGGVSELIHIEITLLPVILIFAGIALLLSVLRPGK
jgi:hypothetical protein